MVRRRKLEGRRRNPKYDKARTSMEREIPLMVGFAMANMQPPPSIIFLTGTVVEASGRKPLAGVQLSNGELIVATDAAGTFEIEAQPGRHRFLTITTSSGYTCAGGWFRRIDEDSKRFDFVLEPLPRDEAGVPFAVAHVTDLHARTSDDREKGLDMPEILAADLAQIERELSPSFFIATGDLTEFGRIAEYEALQSVVNQLTTPFYPAFGMHDANVLARKAPGPRVEPDGLIRDWLDESNFGVSVTGNYERMVGPTHYSFDRGEWHFIVYPNEAYAFSIYDQLRLDRWLDQDLSMQPDGRPVVVATHMAPTMELLYRLARYDVRLVLHGHSHTVRAFRWRDILIAATPPPWAGGGDTNPRGYRALTFDGTSCDVTFHALATVSTFATRRMEPSAAPHSRWETALPAHVHRAAPMPFEGNLIISLQDEDNGSESGVCRVDGSGEVVWHRRTDSAVRNSVAISADGGIFGVSQNGRVSRLDPESGDVVWSSEMWGYPQRWVASSPLVEEGIVYVGAKAGYCAFDAASGERLWESRFSGTMDLLADPVGDKFGAYLAPLLVDDLVIVFVPRRSIMALRNDSGRIVWEEPVPGSQDFWASPILLREHLISGSTPGHLLALRPQTGEVIWKVDALETGGVLNHYFTGLAGREDRIFGSTEDGCVLALDAVMGEVAWKYQTGEALLDMNPHRRGGSAILASPVVYNDCLVVSGVDGFLHLLNFETGDCERKVPIGSPVTAAPVPLKDGLAVVTWDGTLRLIEL